MSLKDALILVLRKAMFSRWAKLLFESDETHQYNSMNRPPFVSKFDRLLTRFFPPYYSLQANWMAGSLQ